MEDKSRHVRGVRGPLDLGRIFLKYISDAFEEQHAKLEAERAQGADPEDPDEYRGAEHPIFWVPPEAADDRERSMAK